jgi:hypothetical protein
MRSDSRWFPALYPPKIQLLHISFQGSPNNHPAFCPLSSYTALAHDGILLYMWRERAALAHFELGLRRWPTWLTI